MRTLFGAIMALGGVILVVYVLVYRFAYPALTETQLFFSLWAPAIAGTLSLFAGWWLLTAEKKKEGK